jgi:hypothetical protein
MKELIRFYKMSFVIGAHGAAIALAVFAIEAAMDGNLGAL